MEKKNTTAQPPTGKSHYEEVIGQIKEADVKLSDNTAAGGANHATHALGCPPAEQAAADAVKNEVLEHAQSLPAVPRTKDEFVAFLKDLIKKIKAICITDETLLAGSKDVSGWAPYYRAPALFGALAMKQRLLVIVQAYLRIITIPEDAF